MGPFSAILGAGRSEIPPLFQGSSVFRIKICGVRTPEDARLAFEAGADAVGLNFYPQSPRYVDYQAAAKIRAEVPADATVVGVFAQAPKEQVTKYWESLPLSLVQLHGDEPAAYIRQLEDLDLLKAFRLVAGDPGAITQIDEFVNECRSDAGANLRLILLDAFNPAVLGGTGERADWLLAQKVAERADFPPLILAGGLTPENVATAIEQARPYGVDVASGVESSPGRKDFGKVLAFVAAARHALGLP